MVHALPRRYLSKLYNLRVPQYSAVRSLTVMLTTRMFLNLREVRTQEDWAAATALRFKGAQLDTCDTVLGSDGKTAGEYELELFNEHQQSGTLV